MSVSQWSVDSMRGVGSQPCIIVAPEHAPRPAPHTVLPCSLEQALVLSSSGFTSVPPPCLPPLVWRDDVWSEYNTTQRCGKSIKCCCCCCFSPSLSEQRCCDHKTAQLTLLYTPSQPSIYCLPTLHLSCCSWSSLALASPSTCFSRSSVCSAASLVWCSSTCVDI